MMVPPGQSQTSSPVMEKLTEPVAIKTPPRADATLRDLCPDDKKRVALLVHHLSAMAKERDAAVARADHANAGSQLSDERLSRLKVQNQEEFDQIFAGMPLLAPYSFSLDAADKCSKRSRSSFVNNGEL